MAFEFAETSVEYGDGQVNVTPPPDATIANGFIPATSTARGQPLAAQFLNYLFRKIGRYLRRDVVTNSSGALLFITPNSNIRLEAVDIANPTRYIIAVGYKGSAGVVHSLNVISSSVLTLGTAAADGTQPVNGGTNVQIVGYSRQIGDFE